MRTAKKKQNNVVIEATIDELAPGGLGVAIVELGGERRAVFVPRVALGDRARLEVDASVRPARGRVLELLAESRDRVVPACPDADRCGACDWMHLSREAQARAHAAIASRALPAWVTGQNIQFFPAPAALAYRSRARVHVSATGGRAKVGMFAARSREPVEVATCAVLAPELERARGRIAVLLEGAHGRGEARIALGALTSPRLPVLDLTWSGNLPAAVYGRVEAAIGRGEWAGARLLAGEATRPATVGDPTPWIRGADGAPLRLAPGGFSQPSEEANGILARRVAEIARDLLPGGGAVVELYAGAGNFTVLLAKTARSLVAVESSREGCDAARANLSARGLAAKVVEADATAYAIGKATDLLVLDPPRTGARGVVERVADKPVQRLIYVSCDPQTLGRDLSLLEGARYTPIAIEAFEMFPQTSHVETVVALERRR